MPEVRQIVTWVQLQTQYNRDGARGILPFLTEAQNLLCMVEAEQFVAMDETTGDLPVIATTANKYAFNFPSNIWRVTDIVVPEPVAVEYDRAFLLNYGFADALQYPVPQIKFGGRLYQKFAQVRCVDKLGSTPAKVVFTVQPGDSTDMFHYIGYRLPTPITSERIAPAIPEQYHMSHWIPATVKLIEAQETGKLIEAREYVYNTLRPNMQKEMNKGEQGWSGHVQRRGF